MIEVKNKLCAYMLIIMLLVLARNDYMTLWIRVGISNLTPKIVAVLKIFFRMITKKLKLYQI